MRVDQVNSVDIAQLIAVLRRVLPKRNEPYPLHEPCFCGNERRYVDECIDTGWVSSVGPFVDRFEQDLARFTGSARAVVTVNGTAALHVCLRLCGVEAEDEVFVPALTFVATANAVVYCGAVPHFVDVDPGTLGVCPAKLQTHLEKIAELRDGTCYNRTTGRRLRALVAMHAFGHPCDIDSLAEVCRKYQLEFVEDAAESLGSYYKGKHTGTFGRVGALSFNGNKIVTTGGGGAILTNDHQLGNLAKHLTTTAKKPHKWAFEHDQPGYNFRLPNLNAALGCAQLENIQTFLAKKRHLAMQYQKALADVPGVRFFPEPRYASSNFWLNLFLLETPSRKTRDLILENLHAEGILARPAWTLMHRLPMFTACPAMDLSFSEAIEDSLINLPSSPSLVSEMNPAY